MASKVLTITVGNEWTKICEVMYASQKNVQVYSAFSIKTPEGCLDDGTVTNIGVLSEKILEVLREHDIKSKDVIFSMQSTKIASKEILAPCIKEPKLSTFIKTNATEYFPVNIDEYVLSYSVLEQVDGGEEGKKNRLMISAAPAVLVDNYYTLARACGLHVVNLDYAGNSTLQLTRLQIDESPSIVIQICDENTIVSILNRNNLQLMRTVPYGKMTVATAASEKRDIPIEDAYELITGKELIKDKFDDNDYVTDSLKYLVNSISRIIDYYVSKNPDVPLEKAYIIFEGPAICGVEKLFQYELDGLEIKVVDVLTGVMVEGNDIGLLDMTSYLANIGAVLQPAGFIPQSVLDEEKTQNSGKYYRLAVLAAILIAVILTAIPLTGYFSRLSDKEKLQSDIKALESIRDTVAEYYDAFDRFTDLNSFDILAYNNNDNLMDFIEYLENEMPSDISVTSMTVTNGAVSMSLTGSSKETLAEFIVVLKEKSNISNVYVPSFSESTDAYGTKTFSCSMTCSISNLWVSDILSQIKDNDEGGQTE